MTRRYFIDMIDSEWEPEFFLVPLDKEKSWEEYRKTGYHEGEDYPDFAARVEGDLARVTFERPFSRIEFRR